MIVYIVENSKCLLWIRPKKASFDMENFLLKSSSPKIVELELTKDQVKVFESSFCNKDWSNLTPFNGCTHRRHQ